MLFNLITRPEKLRRRESMTGKLLILLSRTARARRRRLTRMRNARSSSLKNSPPLSLPSLRLALLQLPTLLRSTMVLAHSSLWLRKLPKNEV
jgi:hypothetical protein